MCELRGHDTFVPLFFFAERFAQLVELPFSNFTLRCLPRRLRYDTGRTAQMPSQHAPASAYTTRELSLKTWPDFVRLFSQGSGWEFCQCMHFHRPRSLPKKQWLRTRAERGVRYRRQKRALVEQGC